MSTTLGNLASRLQQLTVGSARPDRDALAVERDQLRTSPPPTPASSVLPPERLANRCQCAECVTRERQEDDGRRRYDAWHQRVHAVERQLFRLSFGPADPDETKDERDAPGRALVELRADLLRAWDTIKARPWERVIEFDGRGRPVKAWETSDALGDVLAELLALYRGTDEMVYLPRAELLATIERTRNRMGALLVQPFRSELDPKVAAQAGTQPGEASPADKAGLVPGQDPDVLSGTVRFTRRGRA